MTSELAPHPGHAIELESAAASGPSPAPRARIADSRRSPDPGSPVLLDASTAAFSGRSIRSGPESALVDEFLMSLRPRVRAGTQTLAIREARLGSGFPDLLIVEWSMPTWDGRCSLPRPLGREAIRILHFLAVEGPCHPDRLKQLHFRRVAALLSSLEADGLVAHEGKRWRIHRLRQFFLIKRIIAFEAKMSNWTKAIEQASLNRWFATESYVLVPSTVADQLDRRAISAGVGIWRTGMRSPALKAAPSPSRQPVSQASWWLNDYVLGLASEQDGPQ